MIEKILYTAVIYYFCVFVTFLISPFIIGIAVNGIDGLKDGLNMLTSKDYYLTIVKQVFLIFTCIYIIFTLFILFGLFIVKLI